MSKEYAYAYEAGYRDGAINYELDHCPACKNVADLQEALDENARLRKLVRFIMRQCNDGNPRCDECIDWNGGECVALTRMRELGIEVDG